MKISDFKYIFDKLLLINKVKRLNIEDAGVDNEGTPFIKLKNGPIFYGLKSKPKQKKYYNFLNKRYKSRLPFEAYTVAEDIVIRYIEGGLKYGGPKKEMYYKIKPGDNVAEMGSYMGYYTIYLSERIGKDGKIIAIEPMPDNLKILKKNIIENNLQNVIIVPKGVWKERDEMIFHRKKGDYQSGSVQLNYNNNDTLKIPVDTLDNILKEQKVKQINFMLIQLNGVEPEALEGLQNYKPEHVAIAARYSKDKTSAPALIVKYLQERKYKTKIVHEKYVFAELN